MNERLHIAIFASGAGTTLQTLIEQQAQEGYAVGLVVTNRYCPAIQRAADYRIPTLQSQDWTAIDRALAERGIDMVVLAGFLAILPPWFCTKWTGRIINIHPSLLPKFGGKGMYGRHVHAAVLAASEEESGCTVHYVSAEVDGGAIIAQARVGVLEDDTADSLAQRVQEQEKQLLPRVIGQIAKKKELNN